MMKISFPALGILLGLALPALAEHGRLATMNRDPWINQAASDLVASGLAPTRANPSIK